MEGVASTSGGELGTAVNMRAPGLFDCSILASNDVESISGGELGIAVNMRALKWLDSSRSAQTGPWLVGINIKVVIPEYCG